MIKRLITIRVTFAVLLVMSVMAGQADATLTSVSGPASSAGFAPMIIAPPTDVLDDIVTNTCMQGFDEIQGFITTVAHSHDSGVIPAGTLVNSHMIFLNSSGSARLTHSNVVWTFANPILAVMSDIGGTLEAASTFELGNPVTNYTVTSGTSGPAAPFNNRGLETNDSYVISAANQITVSMVVTEPGDWIRVVTVPEPATICLFGLGALALLRKRRP